MATRFRVHVRDTPQAPSYRMPLIGEVDLFLSFEAIQRFLANGAWSLTIPGGTSQGALLKPGRGIVVFLDSNPTQPVFSGPIRSIKLAKSTGDAGDGILTVSGLCDNQILSERLGRRAPREAFNRDDQGGDVWVPIVYDDGDRAPRNSAEFIWGLIYENCMIPAINTFRDVSRRVPYLNMPRQVPPSIKAFPADSFWQGYPVAFSSIEEIVYDLAGEAGLNVRFLWDAGSEKIAPHFTRVRDKSNDVLFAPQAGNVLSYEITSEAPAATRVVLAGAIEDDVLGARRYYEIQPNHWFNPPGWVDFWDNPGAPSSWSEPGWGRQYIEHEWNTSAETYLDVRETKWKYKDDPQNPGAAAAPPPDSAEAHRFRRERDLALVDHSPKGAVSIEAIDTDDCRFGTHYFVGDRVRVLLDTRAIPPSMLDADGVIREQVREVKLSCSANDTWTLTPTIGSADSSSTPYIYRALRRIQRQVEETRNRE